MGAPPRRARLNETGIGPAAWQISSSARHEGRVSSPTTTRLAPRCIACRASSGVVMPASSHTTTPQAVMPSSVLAWRGGSARARA